MGALAGRRTVEGAAMTPEDLRTNFDQVDAGAAALDVDPADWLPVGCPHCAAARAICLKMAGAVWLFQCVACGEEFTLQARGVTKF